MRFVDAPLRHAFGRTPRELLILGTGALMIGQSVRVHDTSWNAPAVAVVTAAFAMRFFAARVAGMALCVAALALAAAHVIDPRVHAMDLAPAIAQFAAGALIFASRDLRTRFDDQGRGLGAFRNFWRDVPPADRRSIARVICAGAATASLLHHAGHAAQVWGGPYLPPAFLTVLVVIAIAGGVLVTAGRSAGFVIAAGFAAATLVALAPRMHEASFAIHGGEKTVAWWLIPGGGYVLVAVPCAALTLALTLPWLARLARRALR